MQEVGSGKALLKAQYVIPFPKALDTNCATVNPASETGSAAKRLRVDDQIEGQDDVEKINGSSSKDQVDEKQKSSSSIKGPKSRKERRGQNKNRPMKVEKLNEEQRLCTSFIDGASGGICPKFDTCRFIHDAAEYLSLPSTVKSKIDKDCYNYRTYGKCIRGLTCLFSKCHTDAQNNNMVNDELWNRMKPVFETTHGNILDRETQRLLRTRKFDFDAINTICNKVEKSIRKKKEESVGSKSLGPLTDEDEIRLRPEEIKRIDWHNKLCLSPLTTVGNLPFRRICVDFGADLTCSEMTLATSILQGQTHEFALNRRHPSEKIWGVQLCANNVNLAAKACHVLDKVGVEFDFVDLNMGCPLDPIFIQGAGSGLMCRTNKVESMAKTMSLVLESKQKPFTVKMRAGVKTDKYIAHDLIQICRDSGVSAVTLHGRTREQRYTKTANWDYIGECVNVAAPMPLFGNGDVLSWEEYAEKKGRTNVEGVMVGRGALMKPWIFQEIKEQRTIDITSSQRLEVLQRYCNYGLDHWGSDYQGVETCRRFLLEWLSFFYRYIPVGILEQPPQRMNHKPPKYFGRDDMETLLASGNADDWVKISEMFLGPVPDSFVFVPKHKANSWS